jgi:hypothetical protein
MCDDVAAMSKVTTILAFLLLTTAGALVFACGDSPNNPPPQTPTGTGPAASSAQPTPPAPPKGGW